jgi:hypothetical protein
MSKVLKVTLLLALAIGFFGAYRYGAAQEGQSAERSTGPTMTAAPTFQVDIPDIASVKHVLQGTYINSGRSNAAVPAATFIAVDPQLTVVCPGKPGSSTCSVSADMWVQNGESTTSGNWDRVCLYVDGSPGPFCNYLAGESLADRF